MTKKTHQVLDTLIQNIENDITGFLASNKVTRYKQHVYKICDLTHEGLIDAMNSADSYAFVSFGDCNAIRYTVKLQNSVFESKVASLETIRKEQLALIKILKDAKNKQISLYQLMRDHQHINS